MGIKFFEKNYIDLDYGGLVSFAITDSVATDAGVSYADYVRNRDNVSGWATTGSTDAGTTTMEVSFGQSWDFDTLKFHGLNWKSYTVKWWDGSAYRDFSSPIAETVNANAEQIHQFTTATTNKIQIVITGTMVANQDKTCTQIIVTTAIGTLTTEPSIEGFEIGKKRRTLDMLSGKRKVQRGVGSVRFKFLQDAVVNDADLTLIETLYDYQNGFLVWLCGGTTTQFVTQRQGYRKKDVYLMMPSSEYGPNWHHGYYKNGTSIDIELVEVV